MSSIKNTGAMENLFDAEQTAASLLESVKVNVENTVKTVDEAATLENKLSEEAAQFNTYLTTMSNAIRKCERGEISREEMLAECTPCVTALKEKCAALKLTNTKITGNDITEEEIAMLREYIVGCKDIVAARKKDLQDSPAAEAATEGVLAGLANFEPATEANMYKEIRQSTEAKTAAQLYKQAKKLYGLGSKEKALEYLKKAQALYESCLEKVKKNYKMVNTERTIKVGGVEDKFKKQLSETYAGGYLLEYFEDRIDACKALELQWNNKAGKSTYAETKAQLKAERKELKAQAKAERKQAKEDAKAAKKAAKEQPSEEREEAVESVIAALESEMDMIEFDLSIETALEAEGDEADEVAAKASGLGAKFRAAFAKLKKGKKEGDDQAVAEAEREVAEATKELEEVNDAAETPAQKSKVAKVAKIGLIAAGSVAITAGLAVVGKKLVDKAKVAHTEKELEKRGTNLAEFKQMIGNTVKAIKKANVDARVEKLTPGAKSVVNAAKELGDISSESFLSSLAFGLEGVCIDDEECEEEEVDEQEGNAFDEDQLDDANESELEDLATEAAIAVMMAEDGIDDSDLI